MRNALQLAWVVNTSGRSTLTLEKMEYKTLRPPALPSERSHNCKMTPHHAAVERDANGFYSTWITWLKFEGGDVLKTGISQAEAAPGFNPLCCWEKQAWEFVPSRGLIYVSQLNMISSPCSHTESKPPLTTFSPLSWPELNTLLLEI